MPCATEFKVYFLKVEICPGSNAAATAKSAKIWKISQVSKKQKVRCRPNENCELYEKMQT